jgi:hypothetical protein
VTDTGAQPDAVVVRDDLCRYCGVDAILDDVEVYSGECYECWKINTHDRRTEGGLAD